MQTIEVQAYAKLNLTLDVLNKRPDGYHDLRMVMQTVTLSDHIKLTTGTGAPLRMTSNLGFLPCDARNLAAAAALRLLEETGAECGGLAIDLRKSIPVCAGLAGGSADAAAVLRGLNRLLGLNLSPRRLAEIGAGVGSDVPYCVVGGTALAEGRGEVLTQLAPLSVCYIVLCKPPFPISTPELFGRIDCTRIRRRPDGAGMLTALETDDLAGVARRMYNVFEDALPPRREAEIGEIRRTLIQHGALGASMSGTGPTVFGIFDGESTAQRGYAALKERYPDTFLTQPMGCAI